MPSTIREPVIQRLGRRGSLHPATRAAIVRAARERAANRGTNTRKRGELRREDTATGSGRIRFHTGEPGRRPKSKA